HFLTETNGSAWPLPSPILLAPGSTTPEASGCFQCRGRGQSGKDFRDQSSPPVSAGVGPWCGEVLVFRSSFIGDAAISLLVTPSKGGLVGPKGDTGETGVTGVEGPRGFPGIPGRKGEPGESAYVYRSAFSVGLESRVTVPNVPIRFTKIFYNLQNHYDGTTGKFHCNIPGLYYFSYHITVYLKDVKVSLYKKDKAMLFTYDQYQEKNVDQASGSVLLHLEVGDQVWLQELPEFKHLILVPLDSLNLFTLRFGMTVLSRILKEFFLKELAMQNPQRNLETILSLGLERPGPSESIFVL
uniref:Adiponectin, C1Q and collagen domain containing n=1 Tax=Ursus maritimus TaxID=29073 RepID=A0A452TBN0_URSMA